MKKSTERYVTITVFVLMTAYVVFRKSFGRAETDKLQKQVDLLEKLISQMEEMTESKEKLIVLRDKLEDMKDSISEISEMDMSYLQQLMDARSQLEQMISNVMKANSETQSAIAANIKG